jgi:hypothetical protein
MDLMPDHDREADAPGDDREDDEPEAKRRKASFERALLAHPPSNPFPPIGTRDGGRVEKLLLDLFPLGQGHAGSLKFGAGEGWQ